MKDSGLERRLSELQNNSDLLAQLSAQRNLGNLQAQAQLAQQQAYNQAGLQQLASAQYATGWTDTNAYVNLYGGTDPQRATVQVPNDPESIIKHIMQTTNHSPLRINKMYVFLSVGIFITVVAVAIKFIGKV